MSRRDTIIIAVLINACLLVILFATAVTKKEDVPYSSHKEPALVPKASAINIEDVERALVKESSFSQSKGKLNKPVLPPQVPEFTQAKAPDPKPPALEKIAIKVQPHIQITVKRGDYLDKIARENETKVDEIMKLNQLTSTQLRIGQVLKIPSKGKDEKSNALKQAAPQQYVVKSGDTLWQIAKNHKMQVSDLLKMNHMSSDSANRLQPGDTLLVR